MWKPQDSLAWVRGVHGVQSIIMLFIARHSTPCLLPPCPALLPTFPPPPHTQALALRAEAALHAVAAAHQSAAASVAEAERRAGRRVKALEQHLAAQRQHMAKVGAAYLRGELHSMTWRGWDLITNVQCTL